jgi:filamentous hemagglutinin family protein
MSPRSSSRSRSRSAARDSRTPSESVVVWLGVVLSTGAAPIALAQPTGLSVQSGTATSALNGSQLTLTTSHQAFLNWQSFNVPAGQSVQFLQPSASSIAWNRIQDQNPSQIFGSVQANGVLILENAAGFHFGPEASVQAAGLVISTAAGSPIDSVAGPFWQFQGAPPLAPIVNYGSLRVADGGSLYLIADRIENRGSLAAPGGQVGLFGAHAVFVSQRPDGRGLSAEVALPSGTVDNSGRITADAGTVALHARVVNQTGLIQANSVREKNGIIELIAADSVSLGATSQLTARGDAGPAPSDGGQIVIQSAGRFTDAKGSRLNVAGGTQGGDGGFVEVSAPAMAAIRSTLDGSARAGGTGGRLLIDPQDIVLGNSGTGSAGSGTVNPNDPPTTLNLDVNSAFQGFSEIHLQATRNLTLSAGTLWDLPSSTGQDAPGNRLILEAGNNLTLANGSSIQGGSHWSVSLTAGRDFTRPEGVKSGTGNLALNGTGSIETGAGDVHLLAGNNLTVAGGFVRTIGGGDITAQAFAGNLNTGNRNTGYLFRPTGYQVDPDLGGISTANGGDVTLKAGQDVLSFLPVAGGIQTDAGSGAFGAAPGKVTIEAGRDVAGHFVVRQGDGRITAGRNAGTASRLLALSVVDGGFTVSAGQDILLQEVRNPNGVFNNVGFGSSPTRQRFDYSADAYTVLTAGNSVQLRGTALPRYSDTFSQGLTPLYPGRLEVTAGAGGILLGNDVTLFPSAQGKLALTTTDGGSLAGTKPGELVQLVMSDSSKTQYRNPGDFGLDDHAAVPIHRDNPEPVRITVDGDLSGVLIGAPKVAEITVGGDLINSRFEGQNLRPGDVTRIQVAGDIVNRNEFTTVPLATRPDFSPLELNLVFPPLNGALVGLQNQFFYDAVRGTLTFQGRMTGDQLQLLLSLPVVAFDSSGVPILKPNGEPVTRPVQLLPTAVAQALYDLSQDVPLNADTGYRIGGGGRLEVSAQNLDLGATAGIVSYGPRANPALAQLFTRGADVNVALSGNLEMFSTTISTLNGGDITVSAGGSVNVGSRDFTGTGASARGIFTVDPSDVTVIARGNINVNGSRIAGYDGGSVLVRSLEGDVDAGSGGNGAATVEKIYVDPVTRQILTYAPTIPGSGILATTFPRSLDPAFPASVFTVGDITVDTPRGDIIASAGGVVQIPLNGIGNNAGTVTLTAGTKDAAGNVVYVGNIDATGSGVIGSTVKLVASGGITGLVFARENIDLAAQQSVNVTALAQGNVSVAAGGTVSGTIVGIGSVSATGATVDAALLSQNVSASGNTSGAQVGFGQGTAAAGATQSLQSDESAKAPTGAKPKDEENKPKQLSGGPKLTRTVGRVTVILPN